MSLKHLLKKINRGVILAIIAICVVAGNYYVLAQRAKPEIPAIEELGEAFGEVYQYGKIRLPEYRDFVVYPEAVLLEHKETLREKLQVIYTENNFEIDTWIEQFITQGKLENSGEYNSKYKVKYEAYKNLKVKNDEATVAFRHSIKMKSRKKDITYSEGYSEPQSDSYIVTTASLIKEDGKWRAVSLSTAVSYMW